MCLALFNLVVVKLLHLFITCTLIHLEHSVIINYVNEGHHYECVIINQNFPLIITERYQFNDTTGCGKQALNGSVQMSGSCEKAALIYTRLSNRYESLLKTQKTPLSQQISGFRVKACALAVLQHTQCCEILVTIAILFCSGLANTKVEWKCGMRMG